METLESRPKGNDCHALFVPIRELENIDNSILVSYHTTKLGQRRTSNTADTTAVLLLWVRGLVLLSETLTACPTRDVLLFGSFVMWVNENGHDVVARTLCFSESLCNVIDRGTTQATSPTLCMTTLFTNAVSLAPLLYLSRRLGSWTPL